MTRARFSLPRAADAGRLAALAMMLALGLAGCAKPDAGEAEKRAADEARQDMIEGLDRARSRQAEDAARSQPRSSSGP